SCHGGGTACCAGRTACLATRPRAHAVSAVSFSMAVSSLSEPVFQYFDQSLQASGGRVPDDLVVDCGVPVDEDVPECDDLRKVGNGSGEVGVHSAQAVQRLAEDLELPLDGRFQQDVLAVGVECPVA